MKVRSGWEALKFAAKEACTVRWYQLLPQAQYIGYDWVCIASAEGGLMQSNRNLSEAV
jgi:hypothetical protein